MAGFVAWARIYRCNHPGWRKSTQGITSSEKLPPKAREYLAFLEKQTGARIGMISTGPERDQTMFVEEFAALVGRSATASERKRRVPARA